MFANPYDKSKTTLLTPEKSMQLQHSIGADIIMCVLSLARVWRSGS